VLRDFQKTSSFEWEDYIYREGQLLAAKFHDGRVVHFDVDHLGSVRLETDATASVATAKYREFWPYGEEATPPGGSEQMKFTGHERDLGITVCPSSNPQCLLNADDVDYMHARYYRPGLGRFLSVDPAGGSPGDPQSWNRYAYVRGNPLVRVDPTGRVDWSAVGRVALRFADALSQALAIWRLERSTGWTGRAWVSPTGGPVRGCDMGCGSFGSSRGSRAHLGTDYLGEAGADVMAPTGGRVSRLIQRVYPNKINDAEPVHTGVEIDAGGGLTVVVFYVAPDVSTGVQVRAGETVGGAQDLATDLASPTTFTLGFSRMAFLSIPRP
jgi:RHS repeat-associated protein